MVARIVCSALVLGVVGGCYDVPTPECGFACGPAGACPSSYACNQFTNRCELEGENRSCNPVPFRDAGPDPDSQDDFTPPRVIGRFPAPGTTDVALSVGVGAQFDEPVDGYNSMTFTVDGDGGPFFGPVVYDPSTLTITRDVTGLRPSTTYTVTVTSGIFDLAGNSVDPPVSWTFDTIADTFAPIVTTRTPAANSLDVSVGTQIAADFNENVNFVSSSSMTLLQDGVTPVPGTVTYQNAFGFRAVFAPETQLAANTDYTVSLNGLIEDDFGNDLSPVSWLFRTGADVQRPVVVTQTPFPTSAGVPVTQNVTASFDEIVVGVSDTSFTLTPQGGSPVAAVVTFAPATRTATLNPTLQLAANTQHTATLTAAITDGANNALSAAPTSWTFTTGPDAFPPSASSISPAPMAPAVPPTTTIVIGFDEPVLNVTTASFTLDGGAITGTIAMSAGNTIATFTPDAVLPASTVINVDLTAAITDAATNALAPLTFFFTTAP